MNPQGENKFETYFNLKKTGCFSSKESILYFSEEKQVYLFVLVAKCHKLRPSNFNYQLKIFAGKNSFISN